VFLSDHMALLYFQDSWDTW